MESWPTGGKQGFVKLQVLAQSGAAIVAWGLRYIAPDTSVTWKQRKVIKTKGQNPRADRCRNCLGLFAPPDELGEPQ
jgi:hypothetical protein